MNSFRNVAVLLLVFMSLGLCAADLNVAEVRKDEDASVQLRGWLGELGYTTTISDARKTLYLKDGLDYMLAIKVTASGLDRIIIYNIYKGKPSNVHSRELMDIVRDISLKKNVCAAYVDKDGDLVLRFVLGFDDRLSPKLFRNQIDHVKAASQNILDEFSAKLDPYYE
jgi:hypothetical protein